MPVLSDSMLELSKRDNPCPGANGTTIGSLQQFQLFCGSDVVGTEISKQDSNDFTQCVDLCSSFHPRCDAVSFSGRSCRLRQNIIPDQTHPARIFDAAVALRPPTVSDCAQLGQSAVIGASNFNVFCGQLVNGADITQLFAQSMRDCLTACSTTGGCQGVSYDSSTNQGFQNCYLKNAVDPGALIATAGTDTAQLALAAVAAPAPAPPPPPVPVPAPVPTVAPPPPPPPPPVTVIPDPVTETIQAPPDTTTVVIVSTAPAPVPVPVPVPTSSTGAGFFTPPAPASTPVSIRTVVSIITPIGSAPIISTQLITVPVTLSSPPEETPGQGGIGGSFATSTAALGAGSTDVPVPVDAPPTSQAWIAAPIVGSIAAVMLIVVMFVMWGRRRGSYVPAWLSLTGLKARVPAALAPRSWRAGEVGSNSSFGGGGNRRGGGGGGGGTGPGMASLGGSWRPQRLDDRGAPGTRDGASSADTPIYEVKKGKAVMRSEITGGAAANGRGGGSRGGEEDRPPGSSSSMLGGILGSLKLGRSGSGSEGRGGGR